MLPTRCSRPALNCGKSFGPRSSGPSGARGAGYSRPRTAGGGPPRPPTHRPFALGGDDDDEPRGSRGMRMDLEENIWARRAGKVMRTFGTYAVADAVSNWVAHPKHKMDYGVLNQYLGRDIGENFFGTRLEHILGTAMCLALANHCLAKVFVSHLGLSSSSAFTFAQYPAATIAHTVLFLFAGTTAYSLADASFNPTHKTSEASSCAGCKDTYSSYKGASAAWYIPFVPSFTRKLSSSLSSGWAGGSVLPATLAYTTVKGFGWDDWGEAGLTDFEKTLNAGADAPKGKKGKKKK